MVHNKKTCLIIIIKLMWTKWYMKWIIYWTADMKSSEAMILAVMNAILAIVYLGKPEEFRTSTGFEPVTKWCRCDAGEPTELTARIITSLDLISSVQCMIYFIYHFIHWFIHHSTIWTHKWTSSQYQWLHSSVRASQQHREVTGSNPVEVLNLSSISSQLLKLCS